MNLTVALPGSNGTTATYSNPVSSDPGVATVSIWGPNPSGHVYLDVNKVSTGTVDITFTYTGSNGASGTITWTFIFN
ncbi:hypothetical protein MHB40_13230 [Lysinibacillus sp. FSL K6-0057]|uniref:hypothetical protein n=1 Tax=Lysinibacillus TaxID=400634 RepID=UPI000ABC6CFC|nr:MULTISPECIES: hypothetical protein [Lysinibacillus]WGT38105.1 hypothetical protein QH639_20115 [Lysinibacillus sp. 1 U-2021]